MLTKREQQVMELVIKGLTNEEISKELEITTHTIKAHLISVYTKLKVKNRVQAAVKFLLNKKDFQYKK